MAEKRKQKDKSREIFGNPISPRDYRKAVNSKKKFARKYGDDAEVSYRTILRPNPYIGPLLGVSDIRLPQDKAEKGEEEFDLEKGIIVGNIRMGFGHYRISMAMASCANALGYKPYWMDLNSYPQTACTKVISAQNDLYSLGSRISQKSRLFNKLVWEPMNYEGFRKLSYNASDQKNAEIMAAVFRNVPKDIPVIAFSVGEEELAGIDTKPLVGHLAAWNYFESVDSELNDEFIEQWHKFVKDEKRVTNDPMEATFIGFNMWVKAVEKAGTTDYSAVQDALIGISVPNLSGGIATMMPNHHITKPVLIGEIQDDGQFEVILIKQPNNIIDINRILSKLTSGNTDDNYVTVFKTDHIKFCFDSETAWTLDGEKGTPNTCADIQCLNKAVSILTAKDSNQSAQSVQ